MGILLQRPLAVGDIEYFFIPKERTGQSVLFPPEEFQLDELKLLMGLPKNLTQLNDPFVYYGYVKKTQAFVPHHFGVYYPDNIDYLIATNPYKHSVKVFLIHSETKNLQSIVSMLQNAFSPIFLIPFNTPGNEISGHEDITIKNPHDFLEKLQKRKEEIEKVLLTSYPKQQVEFRVDIKITDYHSKCNPGNNFRASHSNYYTLNQILGNGWGEDKSKGCSEQEELIKASKESLGKPPDNSDRFKILSDQLKAMTDLEIMVLNDRDVKFPNGNYEALSPLVLIAPFNFPTLGKIYGKGISEVELKKMQKALDHEQSINYISYTSKSNTSFEELKYKGSLQMAKTAYLDGVGYLHASFTDSPVIRFPMLGNSIKGELSFFKPETINNTKWNNSKKLIDRFGTKLSTLIIPKGSDEDLFGMPRQIVAITDLPIEWLRYKEHNLCFTHDVTRIPETPYGGIMASFAHNSVANFEVKSDIMKRTLVVLGASAQNDSDEEFKAYFAAIEERSVEFGFNTVRCKSVQDVRLQIEKYKPDFLIFDCHGGFDSDTMSSYLVINGEKLSGDDIVKFKITAPLVFLSACHTNPNYGYLNKLADAFFEIGCLAITATYFPISIRHGSKLYFRILRNLRNAVKYPVHRNWLAFTCHVIRTSYYKEVIDNTTAMVLNSSLPENDKKRISEDLTKLNVTLAVHLMKPQLRVPAIDLFINEMEKICPRDLIDQGAVPEYTFYTNMGRGDLIEFENWRDSFNELNNGIDLQRRY
jgi:hypothetical protein